MSPAARLLPSTRKGALLLGGVMLVCTLLYTLQLGSIAFLGKDEPKNAQAAREMMQRGDWVLTTLEGEPWYDKPILYYWTALAGYHLFGVGELGARAGPVLAGLLTVYLTFLLGRRVLESDAAGALCALVLGTGLEFWYFARTAVTDSLLTCFVTASLVAYLFAREGVRPTLNLHLAYAAAAVAALAKGPVGIVLPALVILADRLLERRPESLPRLHPVSGAALLLAIAGPWYALATLRSDGQFFKDFILHYNIERFAGSEKLPHAEPFYYYFPFLLLGPFPWSVFLPTGLIRLARSFRDLASGRQRHFRTLLLWIGIPLAFFSLAGSKLPSYLLPTFPALSVILAWEMRRLLRMPGPRVPRPLAAVLVVFALLSASITAALLLYLGSHESGLMGAARPLCWVLAAAAMGALVAALLRRRGVAIACVGASAILAPITVVQWGLPAMEHYASARAIARQAMALQPPEDGLLAYKFYDNSFFFYTDARVERLWERRFIEHRVTELGTVLCFVRQRDLADVRASPRFIVEPLGAVGEVHLLRLHTVDPPGARAAAAG